LLIIACVLPAAIVSASLVYANYRLQREQIYRSTVLLARQIASDMDRELAGVESGLRVLATSPDLAAGDLNSFHQRAREAIKSQIVRNYLLTDREGRQILNTLLPFGTRLPTTGTPVALRRVFESGIPVLTDLFVGPVSHKLVIAMGVPVVRGDTIVYSLNIGLEPDRIAQILSRQSLPDEWVAAVLDGSGTFVARSREAQRFLGQKAVPSVLQYLATNRDGSLETFTIDGIPVVSSFSRSSISNWSVGVAAPKAALEAELYRWIRWVLAGTVFAFGLGLWLATRLAGRVTSSVRGLNDAALALGRGMRIELPAIQLKEADAVGEAIVEASRVMAQVDHLAHHDALTGLCNRVLFDQLLSHQMAAAERSKGSLAILVVDLDDFKSVNDQEGHAAGDRVLKVAAERIMKVIRTSDAAARMGGDEFSIFLSDADLDGALHTAERLLAALSEAYPGVLSVVSASVGIALFPQSGTTAAALLASADRALYRAKKSGKQCATINLENDCLR